MGKVLQSTCLMCLSFRSYICPKFHQIFCTCCLWLDPRLTAMQCYILPVLWMTSRIHIMEGMGQKQTKCMIRPVSQVVAPGAKSDISHCKLLELVFTTQMTFLSPTNSVKARGKKQTDNGEAQWQHYHKFNKRKSPQHVLTTVQKTCTNNASQQSEQQWW